MVDDKTTVSTSNSWLMLLPRVADVIATELQIGLADVIAMVADVITTCLHFVG